MRRRRNPEGYDEEYPKSLRQVTEPSPEAASAYLYSIGWDEDPQYDQSDFHPRWYVRTLTDPGIERVNRILSLQPSEMKDYAMGLPSSTLMLEILIAYDDAKGLKEDLEMLSHHDEGAKYETLKKHERYIFELRKALYDKVGLDARYPHDYHSPYVDETDMSWFLESAKGLKKHKRAIKKAFNQHIHAREERDPRQGKLKTREIFESAAKKVQYNPVARAVARQGNMKMRRRRRNPDNIDVSNIDLRNLTWQELDKLNYDCYQMYKRVEGEYDRREAEDYKKGTWPQPSEESNLLSEFRRRNPDHVVDLTRRRRDIEFDKLLGAASFGPSDPLEQAAENLMNAAEDYCRVRAVPNPRRRMRLKRYY